MPQLKVRLLGSFFVTLANDPLTNFESDKARALLAYLAVEADRPQRREALAGLLWPDSPDRTARTNLRSALANLRQVLNDHQQQPPFLLITRQTIQFNSLSDHWLDVEVFQQGISNPSGARSVINQDKLSTRNSILQEAVEVYRGQFLAGFNVRNAPLFEEWALITRESFQRQAIRAMHQLAEHYLEEMDYEPALQFAQRQIELEPYQEAAYQQAMWALGLNGQRSEALLCFDRLCEILQKELGVRPLEETQQIYDQIAAGDLPKLQTTNMILRRRPRNVGTCPYRGLAAFRERDAPFFFGREAITRRLFESIGDRGALSVLVGSSGSGKSSAIYAGLLPQLRQQGDWLLIYLRPGSQPYQSLATSLAHQLSTGADETKIQRITQNLSDSLQDGETTLFDTLQLVEQTTAASRVLLVIDQFEELYTLCSQQALRRQYLETLVDAVEKGNAQPRLNFCFVLTLRADFMSQALAYRPFADILDGRTLILGSMDQGELRAAIETPAQQQGAAFEPGLVARILNDVGEEPGNLPLLEFALTQLWEQLDQGWLTHAVYEEIGQVGGALASFAEEVYLALTEEQQKDAQQIFVQLVQPGRGTEDTRRLATRSELGAPHWELIQHLANLRLVVTGQDSEGQETVEIIHEALIREWNRLTGWMDEVRTFRIWQEQLRSALRQWEDSGHSEDALLRGLALSKAEEWLAEKFSDLSISERNFILTSLELREKRHQAELVRQEREQTLKRRSRRFLQAIVIVLLLATVVSLGFAWVARTETRQAIEASSLSLAANARKALSEKDFTTALVLASAANRMEEPPLESQRTLLDTAYSPGPRQLFTTADTFPGIDGPPLSVAIMPDTQYALTGFFDGNIIVWDLATGTEVRRFAVHAPGEHDPTSVVAYSGVNDIALHPNGTLAVSGGNDGNVVLWEVATGDEIRRFDGHTGPVRTVAISPNGHLLVSGGLTGSSTTDPGELILWDLKSGQEIRRFTGHAEAIIDASISADGRTLIASAGEVNYVTTPGQVYSLMLWDIETGEVTHRFEGIDRDIPGLALTPACLSALEPTSGACEGFVLTGSADHNLYLWSLESGEKLQTLEGHSDLIAVVAVSPDGRRALTGGADGELILWNLEKGGLLARFNAHNAPINDVAFNHDGRRALSSSNDGTLIYWDLYNAAEMKRFEGHAAAVLDVAFTPDGKYFVSASGLPDPASIPVEEDSLRLWNLKSGQQVGRLDWHLSDIFQVAISPDGHRALAGLMLDQSVRLWDLATGREIRRYEGHQLPVLSVAFTPDGQRGLSGGADSRIILWDVDTGEPIHQLSGHEGGIWSLAVSPDGITALSGADDRHVIWWDVETGVEIHRFKGHNETVSGVAFSPDGKRALSGDTIGIIIEWDLVTRDEIQRFTGHGGTGPIGRTRVVYNPDGLTALSSGWDGTLALWDLQTGSEIHRFTGHDSDFIFDLAVSPDGSSALSGGTDKTIIQWQLNIPPLEELQDWVSHNRYVRELTCAERELYQIEPLCAPQ